jgi:cystathionine beta-lyase
MSNPFDEIINRRGSHCAKWDNLEMACGVSPETGLAMWVADMDFRPPACVSAALQGMVDHGIYGYFGDDRDYKAAIGWWMKTRHGWEIEPDWIFTTHGLVNGTAMCIEAFTKPGDGVVLFTPVYHAFHRVIKAAGREVVECKLVNASGRYEMDFDTYDAQMTGKETMLILCSPHNPGGRVWTEGELKDIAAFAERHNLTIVSDEIHHDLVFPGNRHQVMAKAVPDCLGRLVMMTATTKTFNIAGGHSGNVIIPDETLRARFAAKMMALGISPNSFGLIMATAAYSEEGAAWVDDLMDYLDGNRKLFDEGVNAIPGLASMPLEATYLAWVDFSRTGMAAEEFTARVETQAQIGVNRGPAFGRGGEDFLRFNIAAPRSLVEEAVERLQKAFADLQ